MKLCLFLLLIFIIKNVGAVDYYHGDRRYYATVIDGKTYIALHILKEPLKLIFPKEKTFADFASDVTLYSPTENGKCEDTKNKLSFKFAFSDTKFIRGEIFTEVFEVREVMAYLYEKCYDDERRSYYAFKSINGMEANFVAGICFKDKIPFLPYEKDATKNVVELQPSGSDGFGCPAFIPSYMQAEDIQLMDYGRLELNKSFAGHSDDFWWKNSNDLLSNGDSFNENGDANINILKSKKEIPHFLRIGVNQPLPSLHFNFGTKCNGADFELYVNLRQNLECRIRIRLVQDGFQISIKNVYVKVASPLSINEFDNCAITNPPDVPADQFVLQLGQYEANGECDKAQVTLPKNDVAKEIEALIDRTKVVGARIPSESRFKFYKSKSHL
uniref:Uncharacterized protein n=1 Tax=Panagrolaimus sp. ES5 TaxID=591445 RepID=A0AC34F7X5_9BILA